MNHRSDAGLPAQQSAQQSAHHEAQQLLPWLANGSLAGAELARTEAHLQVCASCREELALLHTLRAAGPGAAPAVDVERALTSMLSQLDAQETPLKTAAPIAPIAPMSPLNWRQRLAANDRSWLRAGVFLQCCVIAGLGMLLAHPDSGTGAQAGAYRALAASPALHSSLVVSFKAETPERELRRILLASGARVVGGPTATGAWMLDTEGAPAAAAALLRAEPAVTLAEPLGAQGRP